DEQVAPRLRGGVGGGGGQGGGLGRRALREVAVDLVGRELEVADAGVPCGLDQHVDPVDVRGDELSRLLDRAVDVRLGGEVDHRVAALQRRARGFAVGDVPLDQLEAVLGQVGE